MSERLRSASDAPSGAEVTGVDRELDLRGEVCPYTFLRARLALEEMSPGQVLRLVVDNPASARDVPHSLEQAGHQVVVAGAAGLHDWTIVVRRG